MSYITIDFESYYSKEYSLRKMTPVEYILGDQWECFGAAVALGDTGRPAWLDEPTLIKFVRRLRLRQSQGEKIKMVSHNALFDMPVLAWRYGFVPDLMIDTLGMSRSLLQAFTPSVSLEKVAQHLGLPAKTKTILKAEGMRWADIRNAPWYREYLEYACNDADLCRRIFMKLRGQFPQEELLIADQVLRCAVIPRFQIDQDLLYQHKHQIEQAKEALLSRCGVASKADLMSNDKFAEALRGLGVEPPTKISPLTGRVTWAFAKTDTAMGELEEHPDPNVQALVAARLGYKSTIEETRTQRLINISNCSWLYREPMDAPGAWLPIPLRYSGAHTHRLSGDWKINMQNLGRGSPLRDALKAPEGYTVVTCDASQIEARVVAWLAGQDDLVEAFAQGRDVYSEFAEQEVYHYPVSKATKPERFVGKTSILGCGFGVGGPKFHNMILTQSRLQLGMEMDMTLEQATAIVQAYRRRNHRIKALWDTFNGVIPQMAYNNVGLQVGPLVVEKQAILLPNGHRLFYHNLRQERSGEGKLEWTFTYAGKPKRIYGGKMTENVVQALARIVTMGATLTMKRKWGKYDLAHQVHDELVYVVRDHDVEAFEADLVKAMSTPPRWARGLPLAAESGKGKSYGDSK